MTENTYLFIDGDYFLKIFSDIIEKWINTPDLYRKINFQALIDTFGHRKIFYYACLDDIKRSNESHDDFELRVGLQNEYFNYIQNIQGCHVQLGALVGGRKKRQKEVDVQLAVDMMTHAFYKNMSKAILLAGDRDFNPVVQSLVRAGIDVWIWSETKSTSDPLIHSADYHVPITLYDCWSWLPEDVKYEYPIPSISHGNYPLSSEYYLVKKGLWNSSNVLLVFLNNIYIIDVPVYLDRTGNRRYNLQITFNNQQKLELFFQLVYGSVEWE